MDKMYAFIDECGDSGLNFEKNTSSHFIITAILVTEKNKDKLEVEVEQLRKIYFQTGEMKSKSIGSKHQKREKIITELLPLNFQAFILVIDKKKLWKDSGLIYKKTYYKFLNNKLYNELRIIFPKIVLVSDNLGSSEYMSSFKEYVDNKSNQTSLFDDYCDFSFEDSASNCLIQLADIIGGSISFHYEETKIFDNAKYRSLLKNKIRIEYWPEDIKPYLVKDANEVSEFDEIIAETALRQIDLFINTNENSDNDEIVEQVLVAKYMRFKFLYFNDDGYILTREFIEQLSQRSSHKYSTNSYRHNFRQKIIAKLRDAGVIIASSSKGYKLPATKKELYDFADHSSSVIIPMLSRIKKCRDLVRMVTQNKLDLLGIEQYKELRDYFDYKDNNYQ